jgi:hypothetical protein
MFMTLLPHMFFCCRTCIPHMTLLLHMFLLPHLYTAHVFCCRTCIPHMSSSFDWFEQLWFEKSIFFGLVVRLLKIFFKQVNPRIYLIQAVFIFFLTAQLRRAVGFFVLTSFFELSQFEQLNITQPTQGSTSCREPVDLCLKFEDPKMD